MTLPDERYRAVIWAKDFMLELCDPKKTPRIPRAIRQQAWSILRHYPNKWDMKQASQECPEVFAERMEDVTRLFKVYEQSKEEKDNV